MNIRPTLEIMRAAAATCSLPNTMSHSDSKITKDVLLPSENTASLAGGLSTSLALLGEKRVLDTHAATAKRNLNSTEESHSASTFESSIQSRTMKRRRLSFIGQEYAASDLNEAAVTKTGGHRRVHFSKTPPVERTIQRPEDGLDENETKELHAKLYYSNEDYSSFIQDRISTLHVWESMKASASKGVSCRFEANKLDEHYCLRGFEAYVSKETLGQLHTERWMYQQAVFLEQARQRQENNQSQLWNIMRHGHTTTAASLPASLDADERMREKIEKLSACAVIRARCLAHQDAVDCGTGNGLDPPALKTSFSTTYLNDYSSLKRKHELHETRNALRRFSLTRGQQQPTNHASNQDNNVDLVQLRELNSGLLRQAMQRRVRQKFQQDGQQQQDKSTDVSEALAVGTPPITEEKGSKGCTFPKSQTMSLNALLVQSRRPSGDVSTKIGSSAVGNLPIQSLRMAMAMQPRMQSLAMGSSMPILNSALSSRSIASLKNLKVPLDSEFDEVDFSSNDTTQTMKNLTCPLQQPLQQQEAPKLLSNELQQNHQQPQQHLFRGGGNSVGAGLGLLMERQRRLTRLYDLLDTSTEDLGL